jgi:cytochrome c2
MTEPAAERHTGPDGLWRWLVGGLVGGSIALGLLIAAYAVGYHEGRSHSPQAASTAPAPGNTAPMPTPSAPAVEPVQVTPALVARGETLFASDGCSACHSLNGTAGVGPSLQGAAGREVMLTSGQTVSADDTYLVKSIVAPDAQIVEGFRAGIMAPAIASYGLAGKPDDVRALVAFIKSKK